MPKRPPRSGAETGLSPSRGRPAAMSRVPQASSSARAPFHRLAAVAATASVLLSACGGGFNTGDLFSSPAPAPAQQAASAIGGGRVKVGLILPMSGSGNAAVAAQSMRNAAEMALAEFNNPDLQLLLKDDAGSAPGAQQA